MTSFKDMIRTGDVKRADAMQVELHNIHEEPGFNWRIEGEDLDQSVKELAAFIDAGGIYPPLEVRPREEGGVWLVDGHRRRRALVVLQQSGKLPPNTKDGKHWVHVRSFEGNDVERMFRVLTSAQKRDLTPLEVGQGYKRLRAFDLSAEDIAKGVHKSADHVRNMMKLADADTPVRKLVQENKVSATEAVKAIKTHGSKAGAVLKDQLQQAKAAGKQKVTGAIANADKKAAAKSRLEMLEHKAAMFDWLYKYGDVRAPYDFDALPFIISVDTDGDATMNSLNLTEAVEAAMKEKP